MGINDLGIQRISVSNSRLTTQRINDFSSVKDMKILSPAVVGVNENEVAHLVL